MSIARNGDGFILDCDGFAIPAADVLSDFFAEHGDDPFEGDPAEWPAWTDASRWTIGADTVHQALAEIRHTAAYLGDDSPVNGHALEAALYEPTEQDWADFHAWCRDQDERNQDLEDARRASEWQDILEGIARFTDEDLMAAGLPAG